MDTWLESPVSRSLLLGGFLVWVVPLTLHAPRLFRLLSYPVGIACTIQATRETYDWEEFQLRSAKKKKIAEYLEEAEMMYSAEAIEQGMQEAFSMPQQEEMEEQFVAIAPPAELPLASPQLEAGSKLRLIQRAIGQPGIDLYLYLQGSGAELTAEDGSINIRQLQKSWGKMDSTALNELLAQFVAAGLGGFGSKGRARLFRLNP